ncbi:MAG: hypothetical protein KTR30_04765 [Saprospiraceae bacterium]|nr:hypothetical protein [Saprospiraceae bacterium]
MDDFYKNLKENLESRPEPSFKEEAWQDLEGRLNDYEQSQSRVVVWPWWSYALLALLPLSVLLNAWLFLHKTDTSADSTIPQHTLAVVDTIVKTQIIYHTDTIIQTQVIRELVSRLGASNPPSWNAKLAMDLRQAADRFGAMETSSHSASPVASILSGRQAYLNSSLARLGTGPRLIVEAEPVPEEAPLGLSLLPAMAPQALKTDQSVLALDRPGLPISTFTYTPPPIWEKLTPQGMAIGAQIGALVPTTRDMADPHAFHRAVQLKVQLPNRWAVWGELGLIDIKYRVQETGETIDIPEIDPPAPNFDFQHVQVWQERTHLLVGLEYAFASRRGRARPTIAAGYNALGFKPYEIFYEFGDADTGTEIQVEKTIERTESPRHYLATRAGYQWPLGRRGLWDLSLNYKYSLNDNRFTNPNMVGLTTTFSVQF